LSPRSGQAASETESKGVYHDRQRQKKTALPGGERGGGLEIAVLVYPGVTMQDFIGPSTVFGFFDRITLYWKNTEPIKSDIGFGIVPGAAFDLCPGKVDILLVPGGPGT
jgi:putative intracellular protease/amidase